MSSNRTKIKKLNKGYRDMNKAFNRSTEQATELACAIREFLPKDQYDEFVKFYSKY